VGRIERQGAGKEVFTSLYKRLITFERGGGQGSFRDKEISEGPQSLKVELRFLGDIEFGVSWREIVEDK